MARRRKFPSQTLEQRRANAVLLAWLRLRGLCRRVIAGFPYTVIVGVDRNIDGWEQIWAAEAQAQHDRLVLVDAALEARRAEVEGARSAQPDLEAFNEWLKAEFGSS